MRAPSALAALAAVLCSAVPALACPVCGTAQSEATRAAFVGSTVFLSLLPLGMIGGLIALAVWNARRLERRGETDLEESAVALVERSPAGAEPTSGDPAERAPRR